MFASVVVDEDCDMLDILVMKHYRNHIALDYTKGEIWIASVPPKHMPLDGVSAAKRARLDPSDMRLVGNEN